jgi:enoyl-CoA hydratase
MLMSYEHILYEERGPVGIITYNRPAMRNAWNAGIVRETIDAIKKINANDAIGAWVLTGAGSVYCAGADIKSPPEPKDEKGFRPTAATLSMGKGDHN